MKKIVLTFLLFVFFYSFSSAQEVIQNNQTFAGKKSQSGLYNDVYVGYGALSVYYFTGGVSHDFRNNGNYTFYENNDDPSSPGTIYIGFSRTLNRVVSTGFLVGYQKLDNTLIPNYGTTVIGTIEDNLLTGMARITFCYLDKPFVRMYSGVGVGITIVFSKQTIAGDTDNDRKILPAGQLTLMGLRFGRALGGFAEFGIGSVSIISAGVSYKFGD